MDYSDLIGIVGDVGGSGLRIAAKTKGGVFDIEKVKLKKPSDMIDAFERYWKRHSKAQYFGIVMAGTPTKNGRGMESSPNIPEELLGTDLVGAISAAANKIPGALVNDVYGASHGIAFLYPEFANGMMAYNLGSGVSARPIINGMVCCVGAEPGHLTINMGEVRQCRCGQWNCAEGFLGGTMLRQYIWEAIEDAGLTGMVDKEDDPWRILDLHFQQGAPWAMVFYRRLAEAMGKHLGLLFGAYGVMPVVVRGGVGTKMPFDHVVRIARQYAPTFGMMDPEMAKKRVAEVPILKIDRDDDGLIGAAIVAERTLFRV